MCKRWEARTVAIGTYARLRFFEKCTNGDKFPRSDFESDGYLPSSSLDVSFAHLVGRHMHAADRHGSKTPPVSHLRLRES